MGRPPVAAFLEELCRPGGGPIDVPVLLLVAHPDDEVIGAGTRLPLLPWVEVAYVTDGYEGGHPDHDAAALAAHLACRLLGGTGAPAMVEFAAYHDRDGSGAMTMLEFLPGGSGPVETAVLS